MATTPILKHPDFSRADAVMDDDYALASIGQRDFPFSENDLSGRLNENIARVEALKIKVLEWPGLSASVRNSFFSELDALRGAFVQIAGESGGRPILPRHRAGDENGEVSVEDLEIEGIIGQSKKIAKILRIISKVAPTDLTVLFEGETGSGKELFARIIHNNSSRKSFVAVNCGAFPSGLIESELFGHVKGAFTGATSDRKGTFEEANGGTIFLDEIGELELSAQVKLLRVLELGELQRVGSDRSIQIDVRVIAATNRDLARMVKKKSFREDLYYRINMCPILIPPLRERRDEIRILFDYFFQKIGPPGRKRPVLGRTLRQYIYHQYEFPGNIRELKNMAHYIAMVDTGRPISIGDLPERYQEDAQRLSEKKGAESDSDQSPLDNAREVAEKERLLQTVQARRGNIRRICEDLALSRARVYQLLRKHTIEPAQYR